MTTTSLPLSDDLFETIVDRYNALQETIYFGGPTRRLTRAFKQVEEDYFRVARRGSFSPLALALTLSERHPENARHQAVVARLTAQQSQQEYLPF